jgi:hypothetical protein
LISIAFLRLAQITKDKADSEKWLELAAQFDPRYSPDSRLFPPPIINQYKHVRAHLKKIRISTSHFAGFEMALVNGVAVDLMGLDHINSFDQTIRLTLLSSLYQPVTKVLRARDAAQFRPSMVPWVTGSCQRPEWKLNATVAKRLEGFHLAALFPQECMAILGGAAPIFPLSDHGPLTAPAETAAYTQPAPEAVRTSHFYSNGWFWFGVAAVAGALVYSQQKNSESGNESHPPTVSGFSGTP